MNAFEVAIKYLGQTEKKGNSGFLDTVFESKMKDVGFELGQAWCSYFAELCARESNPTNDAILSALFDASAVKTFKNFQKAGYTTSMVAIPGSISIWQLYIDGVAQWQGHAGVCVGGNGSKFVSIEGNTNDAGGREGIEVACKEHSYITTAPAHGRALVLLGFIQL